MTAAARAVGSHDPDPTVRNPDWLAEHFLGSQERAMLSGTPWPKALEELDYRQISSVPEVELVVRAMLVRTRFIDDRMLRALQQGVTQLVILGAGMDSRAYRFRERLGNVRVFEVDYGPTQEYKKRRVREVLGGLPDNVTYVSIDFTKEKLSDVLQRAGYRSSAKSAFIWEGVTPYLTENAVMETLRHVTSQSAPGSIVVADFLRASFIEALQKPDPDRDAQPIFRNAIAFAKRAASLGEPLLFGLPDGKERAFFAEARLEMTVLLPNLGEEAAKRYRTRRDGTLIGEPISEASPNLLVEAVVPGKR
jgi:methyltransferase (TIGR00027 family)